MKFEDLPEPEHRKPSLWIFLKKTWYFYLIIIPFVVFDWQVLEWLAGWIAFGILALTKEKERDDY